MSEYRSRSNIEKWSVILMVALAATALGSCAAAEPSGQKPRAVVDSHDRGRTMVRLLWSGTPTELPDGSVLVIDCVSSDEPPVFRATVDTTPMYGRLETDKQPVLDVPGGDLTAAGLSGVGPSAIDPHTIRHCGAV